MMSIGRNSTFLDIYAERDLRNGTYTEEQIQEFVDHFIMKLRMVRFARIHEYNNLFTGDLCGLLNLSVVWVLTAAH